jgi:hypothetical protein
LAVLHDVQLLAAPWQVTQGELQVNGVEMQSEVPFYSNWEAQGHFKFWESKMRLEVELQEVQLADTSWQVRHL